MVLPVCYLTTVGRGTGRRHRIEIWYLDDDDCLYLLSGYCLKADWVRNLLAHPDVTVEIPPHAASRVRAGESAYVADVGPFESERGIREGLDARYHGWTAGAPLSAWATDSVVVRLRPAPLCERCGKPIGGERITALPRATTCITCASRHKRPSRGRTCS